MHMCVSVMLCVYVCHMSTFKYLLLPEECEVCQQGQASMKRKNMIERGKEALHQTDRSYQSQQ